MEKTIFEILTDATARKVDAVAQNLDKETTAGAPWFNMLHDLTAPQHQG
jgi:hypothetical protein